MQNERNLKQDFLERKEENATVTEIYKFTVNKDISVEIFFVNKKFQSKIIRTIFFQP